MNLLIDSFHRPIDYVRLSLIDRCNFQCFYCRPKKAEQTYFPNQQYLNQEDIEKLFLILGKMGVTKVKLTGGEPLLRKDICQIIKRLSKNPYLKDISLTTNGFFLETMVSSLKESGLHRINVSLDTLHKDTFQEITQVPSFSKVWAGITKTLNVGFSKVKLNVVLMKGLNDHEICDFVELSMNTPLMVRFIEFMPTKRTELHHKKYFFSNQEAILKIQEKYLLVPDLKERGTGPSRYYRVNGGKGHIGFISPLSQHFCDRCNRIRLTAKGELKLCLFSSDTIPLLSLIRSSDWESKLEIAFRENLKIKPFGHDLKNNIFGNVESFVSIGG